MTFPLAWTGLLLLVGFPRGPVLRRAHGKRVASLRFWAWTRGAKKRRCSPLAAVHAARHKGKRLREIPGKALLGHSSLGVWSPSRPPKGQEHVQTYGHQRSRKGYRNGRGEDGLGYTERLPRA